MSKNEKYYTAKEWQERLADRLGYIEHGAIMASERGLLLLFAGIRESATGRSSTEAPAQQSALFELPAKTEE